MKRVLKIIKKILGDFCKMEKREEKIIETSKNSADQEDSQQGGLIVVNDTEKKQAEISDSCVQKSKEESCTEIVECQEPDMEKEETSFLDTLKYNERLEKALEISSFFAEKEASNNILNEAKERFNCLTYLNLELFNNISNTFENYGNLPQEKKKNLQLTFLIFHILMKGKYPQDFWEESTYPLCEQKVGKIKNLEEVVRKELYPTELNKINKTINEIQREVKKRDCLKLLKGENYSVGLAKVYEMFWETFVMKSAKYGPKTWVKKLKEIANKNHKPKYSFSKKVGKIQVFAKSTEGMIDKAGHITCEDSAIVYEIDKKFIVAALADGVGSRAYSSIGSQIGVEQVAKVLESFILKNKKSVFQSKQEKDNERRLISFLQFDFAKEFYRRWEKEICKTEAYRSMKNASVEEFSSTIKFVLVAKTIIACANLGDGGFFVRKTERVGNKVIKGGFLLNDGISSVTQHEPLTIPFLKKHPNSMQISFYNKEEIDCVVICSDGVNGFFRDESINSENIFNYNKFVEEFSDLSFNEKTKKVDEIVKISADYNETQGGSGDDSSLIVLKL